MLSEHSLIAFTCLRNPGKKSPPCMKQYEQLQLCLLIIGNAWYYFGLKFCIKFHLHYAYHPKAD